MPRDPKPQLKTSGMEWYAGQLERLAGEFSDYVDRLKTLEEAVGEERMSKMVTDSNVAADKGLKGIRQFSRYCAMAIEEVEFEHEAENVS